MQLFFNGDQREGELKYSMRYITKIPIKLIFLVPFLYILLSFDLTYSEELMGQEIFVAECVGCHVIMAPKEAEPLVEILKHKAPSLRYAGSKFKSSFLLAWLQDPKPIRPLVYNSLTKKNTGTHKRLTRAAAADVTRYLMSLRLKDVEPLKIRVEETLLGKQLFSQRFACYSCHQVRAGSKKGEGEGKITGGLSGPSLVDAGARLNPFWVYTFLIDPGKIEPKTSMPTYAGIIEDGDLLELTNYLATFK